MGNGGDYITREQSPGYFRLLALLYVGGPALITLAAAAMLFLNAIGRL